MESEFEIESDAQRDVIRRELDDSAIFPAKTESSFADDDDKEKVDLETSVGRWNDGAPERQNQFENSSSAIGRQHSDIDAKRRLDNECSSVDGMSAAIGGERDKTCDLQGLPDEFPACNNPTIGGASSSSSSVCNDDTVSGRGEVEYPSDRTNGPDSQYGDSNCCGAESKPQQEIGSTNEEQLEKSAAADEDGKERLGYLNGNAGPGDDDPCSRDPPAEELCSDNDLLVRGCSEHLAQNEEEVQQDNEPFEQSQEQLAQDHELFEQSHELFEQSQEHLSQDHEPFELSQEKITESREQVQQRGKESDLQNPESLPSDEGLSLDCRNTANPMAAVGTDYSLTRSISTESTDSAGMRSIPEPVNRTPVEKVAAPEITKNVRMMFETGDIPDRHEIQKTVATFDESNESGVFENEPVQNEGVVRSGDYVNDVDEVLQKGATRNLLDQWKDKGREEFRADKAPINLAEDEGRVLESDPVRRDDVYREEDTDYTKDLPAKGQARMLTEHWVTRKDEFQKDQRPIRLCENDSGEPSVVENQPEVRTDVLREDDNVEEIWLRKGFTRNLAGFWAAPKEDARTGRDAPIDLQSETDGGVIAENEPAKLDDSVVRSDYNAEEVLPIEKGRARSMVSKWQTRPEEPDRQPFQLDVNPDEVGVYENDPVQLEGVVRCGSQTDDVLGQKGMIKNIAGRFLQTDEGPKARPEMIVIDLADGPAVLENDPDPVQADVVRSEYNPLDEVQVEKGTTRNMVQRWKNQDLEQMTSPRQARSGTEDPAWILEAEKAAESGVFENQPDVRTDVFREVDYEPEMISVKNTRSTRELWTRMGQEDGRKAGRAPELVRFTPPRELTPPRMHQEDYKSFQTITFAPDSTLNAGGSSSPTAPQHLQPHSPTTQPAPPGDQTLKSSSAVLRLQSS